MTTWKQLSRSVRVAFAAPWCLLAALAAVAATPATRALLLDAANHPTADVDLVSAHWTGTLDPARLPASVPLLDGGGGLVLNGSLATSGTISGDGSGLYDLPAATPYADVSGGGLSYLPAGVSAVTLGSPLTSDLDWKLPPASSYPCGATIEFSDPAGAVAGYNVFLFAADGGDTINGAGPLTLFQNGDPLSRRVVVQSDGVGAWTSVSSGVTSINNATGAVTGTQAVAGADIAPNSVTTGSTTVMTANGTVSSSVGVNFSVYTNRVYAVTGNVTFSSVASTLAAGRSVRVRLVADGNSHTLSFPAAWVFVGGTAPAAIAAGKRAVLILHSDGTTDADVTAEYAAQP